MRHGQIRCGNPAERLNAGVRRRSNGVAIFSIGRAIGRLVGAIMSEPNDEWALRWRCLQRRGLPSSCETCLARLAAVIG
jgi:transposase-like protein